MGEEELVEAGRITHFSKINVAVIELRTALSVGDTIAIKGPARARRKKFEIRV